MTPDLRLWSRRVPLAVLSCGVLVPLLTLVVVEVVSGEYAPCTPAAPCRGPLRSAGYWIEAPVVFLALSLVAAVFVVPRIAVWVAVVVAACLASVGSVATSVSVAWLACAVVWTLLGAVEVLGRRRQAESVRSWALPTYRPAVPDVAPHWTQDTRRVAILVATVLVVLAAGLAVWHERELRTVERFEATAIEATATVVGQNDIEDLVVEISGRQYTIPWVLETYELEASIPVLIDPARTRAVLVAEPMDPSWIIGIAAVVVLAALAVFIQGYTRGARRVALLRDGGPEVELWIQGEEHDLLAPSPRAAPCAMLPGGLQPAWRQVSTRAADEVGSFDDEDEGPDLPPPSQMSDDDVRAWVRWAVDEPEDESQPGVQGRVRVVGRLVDGFPVLVVTEDEVLLSERGIRDPWPLRRLPYALFTRVVPRRAEATSTSSFLELRRWRPRRVQSILLVTAAYLLAVAASLLFGWIIDDPEVPLGWEDLRLVLPIGAAAFGLNLVAGFRHPELARHRTGLRLVGLVLTSVIPVHRVAGVTVVEETLVLRLREPEELIPVETDLVADTRGQNSEQTAETVRGWLARSESGSSGSSRLSASAGPPLVFLVLVIIQVARVLLSP